MPLPPEFTFEQLLQAADVPDRGGLTVAGRSLHKHGSREGSIYPAPRGSAATMNRLARQIVEAILAHPDVRVLPGPHGRFGAVIDFQAPAGRGVRYDRNGRFLYFLEPQRGDLSYGA